MQSLPPVALGRVVVGVDGSRNATRAAEAVARFAAIVGVDVVLVHARGLLERRAGTSPTWLPALVDGVRGILDDSPLGRRVAVSSEVVDGSPAEVLLRRADERGTSAVVVGRTGTGSAVDRALGSTSAEVVARSPVPVVVIPEEEASAELSRGARAPNG